MICYCTTSFTQKREKKMKKGRRKRSDVIHGQYTNAWKLGANLKWAKTINHTSLSQFF